MSVTELSTAISSAISFFLVFCLWHYGFRQLAVDAYRQELFEARDRLFDLAERNPARFDFTHPAYGILRTQFNGSIRFAHRLNMVQLFIFKIFRKFIGPQNPPDILGIEFDRKLDTVDCEVQAEIMKIREAWSAATIRFLMRTSLLFYFTLLVFGLRTILEAVANFLAKKVRFSTASFRRLPSRISTSVWDDIAFANRLDNDASEEFEHPGSHGPVVA